VDLVVGLAVLLGAVALAAVVLLFPFLALMWLYDIRASERRQVELLERMGRAGGWLPKGGAER